MSRTHVHLCTSFVCDVCGIWGVYEGVMSFVCDVFGMSGVYEWVTSFVCDVCGMSGVYEWVISHICHTHVTSHVNESCHVWMSHAMCEWVMSHVNEPYQWDLYVSYIHMCMCMHVYTYTRIHVYYMFHICIQMCIYVLYVYWTSTVALENRFSIRNSIVDFEINAGRQTNEVVMSRAWRSRVTHTNESCCTHAWVMSHMHESCYTCK